VTISTSAVELVSGAILTSTLDDGYLRLGTGLACEVKMADALPEYIPGWIAIVSMRWWSDENSGRDRNEKQQFLVDGIVRVTIMNDLCNPILCRRSFVLTHWTSRDLVMKATSGNSGEHNHMASNSIKILFCSGGM
jgi:hypothetical protein